MRCRIISYQYKHEATVPHTNTNPYPNEDVLRIVNTKPTTRSKSEKQPCLKKLLKHS